MSVEVELGQVAHGGFVVGRIQDKVVFVTGGLPGERVLVEITQRSKRFDRATVVDVLRPSPGRVSPPCPIADRCGGCDWQHATPEMQLELKTAVVAEQLARLADITWDGRVQAVEPLRGWRTRMRYAVDESGRVGLRARRSHEVVPLPHQGCMVAAPGPDVEELERLARGAAELQIVVSDDGVTALADAVPVRGDRSVQQSVDGHRFTVAADGFWQVHPGAASVLTHAVIAGLSPTADDVALDLYCGVGLFAAPLAAAGCQVLGIEGSRSAVTLARSNVPDARFIAGDMTRQLGKLPATADLVVLDPPRKGAGAAVVNQIAALGPRAIAYVACDPAALARDLATFHRSGYEPLSIEAFDLFPMTHHVECVAILTRGTANNPRPAQRSPAGQL